MAEHGVTGGMIESWHAEELAYLEDLKDEPPEDVFKVTYFEALEAQRKAQ